jgi:hypothetical protein
MKETAFPNANEWLGVLKTGEKDQLGTPCNKREFSDLDNLLRQHCVALTTYQWTADWFMLRAFHATATMAGSLLATVDGANTNTAESDSVLLAKFVNNWFSRTRSTEPMVIGSKNEQAVLKSLNEMPYIDQLFNVGLLESKMASWLAASPDAIALANFDVEGTPPNACDFAK